MPNDELMEIIPVPLPTEIPEPPALENLPIDVLHSATVEMLLQQNDDLASRLKVNIRRNSVQEQEILKLQRHLDELKRTNDNLNSQNEIIKEKEGLWQRQRQAKERQLKTNEEEIKLLELRYNELYTATQHKKKELYSEIIDKNESIENLKKKVDTRKQVSERGKDKVREMLMSAAGALEGHKLTARQIAAQNELYKKQLMELKEASKKKDSLFKEKMLEISKLSKGHIQSLEENIQSLQAKLHSQEEHQQNIIGEYDEKERDLELKVQETNHKLEEELKNRLQIAKLTEEVVQMKNEKVAIERTMQNQIKEIKADNTRLLEQEAQSDQENKTLSVQLKEHKQILETCEKKLIEVTRDNQDIEKQLESVKGLWIELQNKYEKEKLKSESLNKLNKQLSKKISLDRQEKSISRAQEDNLPTQSEENKDSSFNERLSEIYSSQFGPLDKKNLDV